MLTTSKENNKLKKTLNSTNKIVKYLNDLINIKISLQKSIQTNSNYTKILEDICNGLINFYNNFYGTLLYIRSEFEPNSKLNDSIITKITELTNEQKSYKFLYKSIKELNDLYKKIYTDRLFNYFRTVYQGSYKGNPTFNQLYSTISRNRILSKKYKSALDELREIPKITKELMVLVTKVESIIKYP